MSFSLCFKRWVLSIAGRFSDNGRLSFMISYLHNRGRLPNLNNPKDISEIWIKRVLDGKVNELATLADKFEVRKYVKERGLEDILTPLLGVYESVDEIAFQDLPQCFALKATFGAGMNVICTDKSSLDIDAVKEKASNWLKPRTYSQAERHYNLIPKRLICEGFINDGSGGFPIDYKFMCINGEVACILACFGREKGHADYLPYSLQWEPQCDWYRDVPDNIQHIPKPSNLDKMVEIATTLAKGIDLVRVDLYSDGRQVWFGEMTLTPSGCIFHRWSRRALDEMGQMYRNC